MSESTPSLLSKARLEGLSDATFAIVFTLLVIEIRVPEHLADMSSKGLWHAVEELAPLFAGYGVTVLVLTMFWISHNYFYNTMLKNLNREIIILNMLYLALVSLIPFSAHLLGRYGELPLAVVIYGVNVLAIGLVVLIIFEYTLRSHNFDTSHVPSRIIKQARIRQYLPPGFTILGMVAAYGGFLTLALCLYVFPVIYNVIPGLLNKTERLLGLNFD